MKLGYALGGGAVRGAAHIGVLRELERHNLKPTCLAGTSIGAVVGAAYAAGHSPDDMHEIFRGLAWSAVVRPTLKLKNSLFSRRPFEKLLRDDLGLTTFEALELPLAVVACDLLTGASVVLDTGDLVSAICASSALPGLFPPVQQNGELLVDGGITSNLPVGAVRSLGAEFVIAVDLLPVGSVAAVKTPLEAWQRSLYLLMTANQANVRADLRITPDIASFSFSDFKDVEALIEKGAEAARATVPAHTLQQG